MVQLSRQLFLLFLVSGPFLFYSSIGGIRLIIVPVTLTLMMMLLALGTSLRRSVTVVTYIPILIFLGFSWALTGDGATFVAAAIFFSLFAFATMLSRRFYLTIDDVAIKNAYLYSAVSLAVGVIVQWVLYRSGIEVGRVEVYGGGRTAFSFLWTDFSFISLFFMSALPFVFNLQLLLRAGFAVVLFVGALVSTGRTGVAAVMLALALYILFESSKAFASGRMKPSALLSVAGIVIVPLVAYWASRILGLRTLSISGSGRIEGYQAAFDDFAGGNLLFGRFFDHESYVKAAEVVPHNLLLYLLVFGGVIFVAIFFVWLATVLLEFWRAPRDLFYSMLIILIGTMLIPSFFSMYFFAVLLSMAIVLNSRASLQANERTAGAVL